MHLQENPKRDLYLQLKYDVIHTMDHMRISGTEPSSFSDP